MFCDPFSVFFLRFNLRAFHKTIVNLLKKPLFDSTYCKEQFLFVEIICLNKSFFRSKLGPYKVLVDYRNLLTVSLGDHTIHLHSFYLIKALSQDQQCQFHLQRHRLVLLEKYLVFLSIRLQSHCLTFLWKYNCITSLMFFGTFFYCECYENCFEH